MDLDPGATPLPLPLAASPLKLVAVDMGYGHLRPAQALAEALEQAVLHADEPPLAQGPELSLWRHTRWFYERLSRASQRPFLGALLRMFLARLTDIPHLHPARDLSLPTLGVRSHARLMRQGLGRGLVEILKREQAGLLTTFYSPALVADAAGCRATCVVTDADVNRLWVPTDAAASEIEFCVGSPRAQRRLKAYGVRPEKIHFTGYPLPGELLGGPGLGTLKRNLAARLVRLDPGGSFRAAFRAEIEATLGPLPVPAPLAPLVTFTVGGAGSQAGLALTLLESFRGDLVAGKVRLALVAATHGALAARFHAAALRLGLRDVLGNGLQILAEPDLLAYFRRFNALLAQTDVLFTKPSELTFFAALGIPLVFSWPVGVHERYNRRWAIENGAGLKQHDPRFASEWIGEWLADGTLASAAWSGFRRLPKLGLYRILEVARDASPR